jgi:mono/diheme cytochrome c family protein
MRNPLRRMMVLAVLASIGGGCDLGLPAGRAPHREGNRLDMVDQPKPKPQRADMYAGSRRLFEPPAGVVAVDEHPYAYTQGEADRAGRELVNPLPPTPRVIAHGEFVYQNVCVACHGPRGAGDGAVATLFPKPPSLMTQKVRDWPDGQIFHRPMRGQGSMPSHARQIDQRDAWSIVHYIRKLQAEEPVAPPPPEARAATGPGGRS